MRIHIVVPITTPGLSLPEHFHEHASAGTEIVTTLIESGPASIESQFDEAVALPGILTRVVEAERDGADAIIIDCMGDPGLQAAREITSIPVIGPAQAAMHIASMTALNFSILTTGDSVVGMFDDLIRRYGMIDRVRSLRTVSIPPLELELGARLERALREQAELAYDDGAHAIVFGCTGMRGWARMLEDHIAASGRVRIPVIDPVAVAVKTAESLAQLHLAPSRRSYPTPPAKAITGYEDFVRVREGAGTSRP